MNHDFSRILKSLCFSYVVLAAGGGCADKKPQGDTADAPSLEDEKEPGALPDGLTPEDAAKVVAKVGETTITVGDVTRQINRLSPYVRRRWAAPEKRKEFLDKLIRVELLSQEAERLGLTEDPAVQRTTKQVMIRLMMKNDLEKELFPTKIEEDLLKMDYEKEKSKYERPEQVRASHIVLTTKAEAEKVLQEVIDKKKDSQFFRQKARVISIDQATKDRGGDIGYFSKGPDRRKDEPEVDNAVVEAAWKLTNNGDISSSVIKTEKGFHVVRLTNKRAEMNRSFESVKRMIENKLLREKRQEIMTTFIDDLKKQAKVEIFKDNLARAEFNPKDDPAAPMQPPAPNKAKQSPKHQ